MRITILGKRWLLQFVPWIDAKRSRGHCDPPDKPNKEILILERLKGEERLEILIHECLHAAQWHLDEEFVKQFSIDLARNLTKLGYTDGKTD